MHFIRLCKYPSTPDWLRSFLGMRVGFSQMRMFCICWCYHIFSLICWLVNYADWSSNAESSCILGINLYLSLVVCVILFVSYWIWLAIFCWGFLHIWGIMSFFSCNFFVRFWFVEPHVHKMNLKLSHLLV